MTAALLDTADEAPARDGEGLARSAIAMSPASPGRAFLHLLVSEIRRAGGDGAALGTALGFYGLVITVLPFGVGPELKLLATIAPGMIWISVVLSALLSVDRLFAKDHRDGVLEILMMGPLPLELVVLAKSLAHWLTTVVPLIIATPVTALMLSLDMSALLPLLTALVVGTPTVSAIGAIGAALTLGLQRGGLLLTLIVLPLFIPVVIFGVGAAAAVNDPLLNAGGAFALLAAMSLVSMVLAPLAGAAALRTHICA